MGAHAPTIFSIHDLARLDARARELRVDPHRLRLLLNSYYKRSDEVDAALAELDSPARERLAEELCFESIALASRHDSEVDGASKLLFRTRSGLLTESVILRFEKGRTALCVSSQVGCAANCAFCATAKMGVVRDLSPAEILDQVLLANRLLRAEDRRVRNIVLMGMGEPLHNEAAVHEALDVLLSTRCFAYAPRRVVVSTVGVPDAMQRLARRHPGVLIALSLHAARQETRERIVPFAKVAPLDELRETVLELNRLQDHAVMIEYLLLEGLNDGDDDVEALAGWLEGLRVHVNLIPYNPIADADELRGTPRSRREAIGARLRSRGFAVTLRRSLGADIEAACGQLVRKENRAIARAMRPSPPEESEPSRG